MKNLTKQQKQDQYENTFIINQLITGRKIRLHQRGLLLYPQYIQEIIADNQETDRELSIRFTVPYQDTFHDEELHFDRCDQSGIQECICLINPNETTVSQIL